MRHEVAKDLRAAVYLGQRDTVGGPVGETARLTSFMGKYVLKV